MINVLKGQSFFDIAIQETGDIANVYAIANANDISITDELTAGQDILIPDDVVINKKVISYYRSLGFKPASGIIKEIETPQGIGFWSIGNDFKVS